MVSSYELVWDGSGPPPTIVALFNLLNIVEGSSVQKTGSLYYVQKRVIWRKLSYSLAVLTVSNNTPSTNVNGTKVAIRGNTANNTWRIRDTQMKRKEVNCFDVWISVFLSQSWVKVLCNWSVYQKACWYLMLKILMERRPQKRLMPWVGTVTHHMQTSHIHIISIFVLRTEDITHHIFY